MRFVAKKIITNPNELCRKCLKIMHVRYALVKVSIAENNDIIDENIQYLLQRCID